MSKFFLASPQQQFDELRPHVHLSWESAFWRKYRSYENIFHRRQKRRKTAKKVLRYIPPDVTTLYVFCCCFYLIFAKRTNAATTELKRMKLYSNLRAKFCVTFRVSQKQFESFRNLIKSLLNASSCADTRVVKGNIWMRKKSSWVIPLFVTELHRKLPYETSRIKSFLIKTHNPLSFETSN